MWLQDTGILTKLRDDELKAPNPIPLQRVKFNQPLTFFQLATAFLLVAVGVVISLCLFVMELLNTPNEKAEEVKSHKIALGISPIGCNRKDTVQDSLMYSGKHITL